MNSRGTLFIISAPSGAGKTTLYKMLIEAFNDLIPSISCTTRPKRDVEVNGLDYFFVPDREFDDMINNNQFIEWATVHKHRYGTPRDFIEKNLDNGKDILFDVDVQGAKKLKKLFPQAVLIFILPPSYKILKERLTHRMTNVSNDIKLRLDNALNEIKSVKESDYLIINSSLQKAFDELKAIIISHRAKLNKENFNLNEFMKDT